MNIYDRFRPRAPSQKALGMRLMNDRRGIQTPVPVRQMSVNDLFTKALASRAMVTQPAPYGLATATSRGLAGFSGLGAFSGVPLGAGGIEFKFDLDRMDFFGRSFHQQGLRKLKLSYTPPSGSTVAEADAKLAELSRGNAAGTRLRQELINEGQRLATRIFEVGEAVAWESVGLGARGEVDIFGNVIRNEPERSRVEAMEQLRDWLDRVAALDVRPYQRVPTPSTTTTPGGSLDAVWASTGGGMINANGPRGSTSTPEILRTITSGGNTPTITAPLGPSKTLLIGGGLAFVAVGAVAYFLLKK